MKTENRIKTLYICYFGLREPLVQTQVVAYLQQIAEAGVEVNLLTFEADFKEKWTTAEIETERRKLAEKGIRWFCLPYHKKPSALATFYDIFSGARFIRRLIKKEKIEVLHARTHIPFLMAFLARKSKETKIIFDIRGLLAEEYADAGIWSENSFPYKMIKRAEKLGLKHSSFVVVLTEKMKRFLVENNLKEADKIQVIPCCVDFSRLDDAEHEKSERFELIYAGSVTGLYLLREMGQFFLELKKHRPAAFFRILTGASPEAVRDVFEDLKISPEDYSVQKVSPKEVFTFMSRARVGISFRKPTFSQIAASPTKIPEYLACGLPVVSNFGIGDMDELLTKNELGVLIEKFDQKEFEKAAENVLRLLEKENLAGRCIEAAHRNFDLRATGKNSYLNVYKRLGKSGFINSD